MNKSATEKIIELLKSSALFQHISPAELNTVINEYSDTVSYCKDEEIFSRNNYRHAVGLVISGSARVMKGKMLMSNHKPGDIFGAVTLFGDSCYYATEIIAQTACEILFINKDGIIHLMQNNVEFSENYIAYLSQRIYFLNRRIDSLTAGNIENKLIQYIEDNAEKNENGKSFTVKSYGALAANLDSGRASLYRAMDALTEKGIISREGKTIFLKKE
jgi:CRP-like cAMP-binding protein